jgi:hypothetical protein
MDESLVRRFQEGDLTAVMAVRNHLRDLAGRALSAGELRVDDEDERSKMEQQAAAMAIAARPDSAVAFAREALRAALTLGIERWRREIPPPPGDHPAPALIAAIALETASLAQARLFKQHADACPACAHLLTASQHTLRAAIQTEAPAAAPPPAPGRSRNLAQRQPDALPPSVDTLSRVMAEAAAEADDTTSKPSSKPTARPAPKQSPSRPAASAPRRARAEASSGLPWIPIVLVTLGVGFFAWRDAQPSDEQRTWATAALLPPELPPTDLGARYEGTTRAAFDDMGRGGCRSAAGRFRSAARSAPQDPMLPWAEGLALVCARDGKGALLAFKQVEALGGRPFGWDWWTAQALLLDGQLELGLGRLDGLGSTSHPRAAQARALAARVRDTLY